MAICDITRVATALSAFVTTTGTLTRGPSPYFGKVTGLRDNYELKSDSQNVLVHAHQVFMTIVR